MNAFVIGILAISFFSALAIVLIFILIDSIKNKRSLGRQIPMPPEKLRKHALNRNSRN